MRVLHGAEPVGTVLPWQHPIWRRGQFGRPIGSFQPLQHGFADLATELEAARLMTWWVATLTDEDPDRMLPKEPR